MNALTEWDVKAKNKSKKSCFDVKSGLVVQKIKFRV